MKRGEQGENKEGTYFIGKGELTSLKYLTKARLKTEEEDLLQIQSKVKLNAVIQDNTGRSNTLSSYPIAPYKRARGEERNVI